MELQLKDFSEDEKKAIVEDCTVKLIGPKVLSQQYKTSVLVIRRIVSATGLSIAPDDLSKFPDFPKMSDDMTQEQYQKTIKRYWKLQGR